MMKAIADGASVDVDQIASAVGSVFVAVTALIAYLTSRRDKDGSPVTKADADTAFVSQAAAVAASADGESKRTLDAIMLTQAMAFAAEFNERATAAEEAAAQASKRYDDLDRRFTQLESELHQTNRVLVVHVGPIVSWIDNGATPPAPTIASELREILSRSDH